MDPKQKKQVRFSTLYFLIALVGMWLFQALIFRPYLVQQQEVPYSQFRQEVADGEVDTVTLGGERILYTKVGEAAVEGEEEVFNVVPIEDPELIDQLVSAGVEFSAEMPANSALSGLLGWIIPLLPLALIWWFMIRRMGQAGAGVMSIGKSKAREIAGEIIGIGFKDVGGADEVGRELKEIIEFIKDPDRFTRLGARLPKGVLLVGPPGTGKTLLARATAGEAGAPFFSISGSDFVEMFVGVGASRVRDLFEQAKAKAPCIVFIDEIDAIGGARSSVGAMGRNDEREQTLNQLLAEMDGFEANAGVVIMAATNRPEILDHALLRPGRFDRQVQVSLPTVEGRRQILDIHTKEVQLGKDADLDRLAQVTPGFSGADLANIVNEAALLAVRNDSDAVAMEDFDLAIERVVAGLQRRMPLRPEIREKVAYHEGGHALVAQLLPNTDPVHKVSIIPTAKGALGYTLQMPEEDQYLLGETELMQKMSVMLGGRAAELLVYDEISTGAANDLERATSLARRMVTEFGMSEALGPVRYLTAAGTGYLSGQAMVRQDISPETARMIDEEIRRLVEQAQGQAMALLHENQAALDEIAVVLQAREVISGDDICDIAIRHREKRELVPA